MRNRHINIVLKIIPFTLMYVFFCACIAPESCVKASSGDCLATASGSFLGVRGWDETRIEIATKALVETLVPEGKKLSEVDLRRILERSPELVKKMQFGQLIPCSYGLIRDGEGWRMRWWVVDAHSKNPRSYIAKVSRNGEIIVTVDPEVFKAPEEKGIEKKGIDRTETSVLKHYETEAERVKEIVRQMKEGDFSGTDEVIAIAERLPKDVNDILMSDPVKLILDDMKKIVRARSQADVLLKIDRIVNLCSEGFVRENISSRSLINAYLNRSNLPMFSERLTIGPILGKTLIHQDPVQIKKDIVLPLLEFIRGEGHRLKDLTKYYELFSEMSEQLPEQYNDVIFPEVIDYLLQGTNERDRTLLKTINSIFNNSTILNEERMEIFDGKFDENNDLSRRLVYVLSSNPVHQGAFEYFPSYRYLEESLTTKADFGYLKLREEIDRELKAVVWEAYIAWKKILEIEKRAKELGRDVVIVENLSYGGVSLAPIKELRGDINYIVGTDIRVISTKIASTGEEEILTSLFSYGDLKCFAEEQPIIVVVDGTPNVPSEAGKKARIPSALINGYQKFVKALNYAILKKAAGRIDTEQTIAINNDVRQIADDKEFQRLVTYFSYFKSNEPVSPYDVYFWYPGKAPLDSRGRDGVKKLENVDEMEGPSVIMMQTVSDIPSLDEEGLKFIGEGHIPGYFDDRDQFKEFHFEYDGKNPPKLVNFYKEKTKKMFADLCKSKGIDLPEGKFCNKSGTSESVREETVFAANEPGKGRIITMGEADKDIRQFVQKARKDGKVIVIVMDLDKTMRRDSKSPIGDSTAVLLNKVQKQDDVEVVVLTTRQQEEIDERVLEQINTKKIYNLLGLPYNGLDIFPEKKFSPDKLVDYTGIVQEVLEDMGLDLDCVTGPEDPEGPEDKNSVSPLPYKYAIRLRRTILNEGNDVRELLTEKLRERGLDATIGGRSTVNILPVNKGMAVGEVAKIIAEKRSIEQKDIALIGVDDEYQPYRSGRALLEAVAKNGGLALTPGRTNDAEQIDVDDIPEEVSLVLSEGPELVDTVLRYVSSTDTDKDEIKKSDVFIGAHGGKTSPEYALNTKKAVLEALKDKRVGVIEMDAQLLGDNSTWVLAHGSLKGIEVGGTFKHANELTASEIKTTDIPLLETILKEFMRTGDKKLILDVKDYGRSGDDAGLMADSLLGLLEKTGVPYERVTVAAFSYEISKAIRKRNSLIGISYCGDGSPVSLEHIDLDMKKASAVKATLVSLALRNHEEKEFLGIIKRLKQDGLGFYLDIVKREDALQDHDFMQELVNNGLSVLCGEDLSIIHENTIPPMRKFFRDPDNFPGKDERDTKNILLTADKAYVELIKKLKTGKTRIIVDGAIYESGGLKKDLCGREINGRYIAAGDVCSLERCDTSNSDEIIKKIKSIEYPAERTIVQVSDDLSAQDISKLESEAPDGVKFMRIDTNALDIKYNKELDGDLRWKMRFTMYAMLIAARNITNDDLALGEASYTYRILQFLLHTHGIGDTRSYIEALTKNDLMYLVTHCLSFAPIETWSRMEEYYIIGERYIAGAA